MYPGYWGFSRPRDAAKLRESCCTLSLRSGACSSSWTLQLKVHEKNNPLNRTQQTSGTGLNMSMDHVQMPFTFLASLTKKTHWLKLSWESNLGAKVKPIPSKKLDVLQGILRCKTEAKIWANLCTNSYLIICAEETRSRQGITANRTTILLKILSRDNHVVLMVFSLWKTGFNDIWRGYESMPGINTRWPCEVKISSNSNRRLRRNGCNEELDLSIRRTTLTNPAKE